MSHHPERSFRPIPVNDAGLLESIVSQNIEEKRLSYYLFVSDWDQVSNVFLDSLKDSERHGATENVYVVNTFDIPNGLNILRSMIESFKQDTRSTNVIRNYTKLPMLVKLQGWFPILVDYNGSIAAELSI